MLRFVLFDLSLFANGTSQAEGRKDLGWLLEALTQRDQAYLKDHPNTPLLYKSGVVYERPAQFGGECEEVVALKQALGSRAKEPKLAEILDLIQQVLGGERFRDIGRIIEKGAADCDNVATWRAAELRQAGIKASPYITWKRRLDGGSTYHVLVRWPDNTLEDPSLLLGMGGESRAKDRQEEIRKNAERVQKALAAAKHPKGSAPSELQAALDEVVGAHAHRPFQPVIVPVDEWGIADLDREFGESFDDAMVRRTGSMRGGR